MSTLKIIMTGRAPVEIDEDRWPLIAGESDYCHDGQVRSQATRESQWAVGVRRHADGRVLVFATYEHDTQYRGERRFSAARGNLLTPQPGADIDLARAIQSICMDISSAEHKDDDANRWPTLANDCIANLPAEKI